MARPKKAKVEYFPHSVHHGKTLYILENKFGNDGYAFWFKLLELLGDTNHHYFDCNSTSSWEFLLAKTSVSGDIATEILNILAEMKAIDDELWGKKIIWSENFIANLDTVYSRREINPYNKQDIKDKCIKKLPVSGVSDNINPQSKVKESKVKKSKALIESFDLFWSSYPKKIAKKKCLSYWRNHNLVEKINEILSALEKYKKTQKWQETQFIPYPYTWLNQERWEDEIPKDEKPKNSSLGARRKDIYQRPADYYE